MTTQSDTLTTHIKLSNDRDYWVQEYNRTARENWGLEDGDMVMDHLTMADLALKVVALAKAVKAAQSLKGLTDKPADTDLSEIVKWICDGGIDWLLPGAMPIIKAQALIETNGVEQ